MSSTQTATRIRRRPKQWHEYDEQEVLAKGIPSSHLNWLAHNPIPDLKDGKGEVQIKDRRAAG